MPFLFDRSRLDTYQRCPRRYYWNYVHKGLGIAPLARPLPLAFGGSIHLGLEQILLGRGVEEGIKFAQREFELQARSRGLELQANESAYEVYKEHNTLLEALLRAWYLVRYPSFIEEYEIIDLEREEEWKVLEDITFMARADGILRSKLDGGLYVLSFKTAKQYGKKTGDQGRSDIQGISELVAVEERLGERVQGIQMEYLIKGRRDEWPKGSGIYQTANPLIRPWCGPNDRLAHSWYWEDLDGGHTLGSKYRKVFISDRMPIKEWVAMLAAGQIQPEAGPVLEKWIVSPITYCRNRDEVESWKKQAKQQAEVMQSAGAFVEEMREFKGVNHPDFHDALDISFVQHRHSCEYPTRCPYYDVCFGAGPDSGKYVEREPHHELEQRRAEQ